METETVGETSVSSGCWGEDSNCELAGAAHFHVASPALYFKPDFPRKSWILVSLLIK